MRRQLGHPPPSLWLAKRRICRDVNGEVIGLVAGLFQDAAKKRQGLDCQRRPVEEGKLTLSGSGKTGRAKKEAPIASLQDRCQSLGERLTRVRVEEGW